MSDLPAPYLRLRADFRSGALHLHANLELTAPWTVIYGPSGSGKSTLLRAACGLLESGSVELSVYSTDLRTWVEVETRGRSTPPHLRHFAYAPQGAVLFPHLSVRRNVSFAADATGHPAADLTSAALDLFDLTHLAERLPRDLSGGERQRVNLARAFAVPSPKLFLLDEPFTGIDRSTRERLILSLRQRIAHLGIPVLSVTHDVEEVLLLGADVVRLEEGRIVAQGPASEVLAAERNSMVRSLQTNASS